MARCQPWDRICRSKSLTLQAPAGAKDGQLQLPVRKIIAWRIGIAPRDIEVRSRLVLQRYIRVLTDSGFSMPLRRTKDFTPGLPGTRQQSRRMDGSVERAAELQEQAPYRRWPSEQQQTTKIRAAAISGTRGVKT